MLSRILKSIMPRGLYWRAALILFVPVVTILLVVSVVFIQRHYEGVTRQMTDNYARTVAYMHNQVERQPDRDAAAVRAAELAAAFDVGLIVLASAPSGMVPDKIAFYDLNSRFVLSQLRRSLHDVTFVGLVDGEVGLQWESTHGHLQLTFPLSQVTARNPHQLLVVMLISGFIMSLISFLFLKNQVRSIRRLAEASEAFGRGEVLPYDPGGATEVRAAGHAFLEMRRRIERHIEQRTLMLSGVSHDLRTPLTRMKLGLSMLDHEPEARALLADVQQMEALIDRFLEFARADVAEEAVEVNLRDLVSARVAAAQRAGQTVSLRDGPDPGVLLLRRELLSRALDNLMSNASRYARRAEVRLALGSETLDVIVEDDGPGIAPELLDEATKPFVRLDAARNASGGDAGGGAGLGLAIAADAVRSHGGRLVLGRGQTPGLGGLEARLVLPSRFVTSPAGPAQRRVAHS